MTLGVIVIDEFVHVMVPSFTDDDNVITGIVLSKVTSTILLLILVAQPETVFVTITLYEPAAVKVGLAVVSVPGTIPETGDQL